MAKQSSGNATLTEKKEKNKGGRPIKYTYEELEAKLNAYFANEENKPFSILEICAELGISKETWNEWEHNETKGFSDLIKRSKLKVASGWEKGALNPALSIFLLKNHMQYTDKQEIAQTSVNTDLTSMTEEERKKRIEELLNK